jgi:uncharacterized protein (TIGR02996 family)
MSGKLEKGFLDDIVANIDDDTPRLVYADWLAENGQDDRAEFVRVQVERARLPEWEAAQVRLRLRERRLLDEHGERWLKEMPAIKGVRWEGFRRGIVAEVSFTSYEAMRTSAPAVRAAAPVEAATTHWPRKGEARGGRPIAELRELVLHGRPWDQEIAWLADSPQLSTLRSLSVLGLTVEDLARLAASPHLTGLRTLRLTSNGLGNAGVRALTQSDKLAALEVLDLSGPGYYESYYEDPIINAAGMEALAGWAGLAHLRSLTLEGHDVRRAGLRALLSSPNAAALKELSLRKGRLDGRAMEGFLAAAPGLRLESLDVGDNVLKKAGVEYLAAAPCLGDLKALRLDRCEVPLDGAKKLANDAVFLGGLRRLDAGHNSFGPAGLAALLEREPSSLHTLGLRDNDLFDKGAQALAGSPTSNVLMEVDLAKNGLTSASAQALGESAHLRGLLVLRLADNDIGDAAAAALAASPLGQRLGLLELVDPRRSDPDYYDEDEDLDYDDYEETP